MARVQRRWWRAASDYVASLYAGLAPDLRPGCDLDDRAEAHATSGGINELFRAHLFEAAVLRVIEGGLDRVLDRVATISPSLIADVVTFVPSNEPRLSTDEWIMAGAERR